MRIGVDLAFFEDKINFGVGLFSVQLLRGILLKDKNNTYVVFVTDMVYDEIKNKFKDFNVEIVALKSKIKKIHAITKFYRLFITLPYVVRKNKIDCYINFYTAWYSYVPKNIRMINVVHDLHFEYYPEFYSWTMLKIIQYRMKNILKKCDSIITISQYVRDDVIKFLGKSCKSKVNVIPNPVTVAFSGKGTRDKFILSVNSFAYWKNQITLLKAYSRLLSIDENFPYRLVLVGYGDADKLTRYVYSNDLEDKVFIEQDISEEKLKYYYDNARLFVNTSLFEGFGRGNIEAAMMMVPVLTTEVMCMREVSFNLLEYYSPATDDVVLMERIQECIAQNRDDDELKYIKDKFDFEYSIKNVADKYIKVINSII